MITETATLDGQVVVVTSASFLRLFKMSADAPGSSESNIGTIYAGVGDVTAGVPATPYCLIDPGYGQSMQALYTVPQSYTALLFEYSVGTSASKAVETLLFTRSIDRAWTAKGHEHFYQSRFSHEYRPPRKFQAKTDIELRVRAASSGGDVSGGFDLLLLQDV